MKSEIHSTFQKEPTRQATATNDWFLKNKIQFPGLTPGAKEIARLAKDLSRRLGVFLYKKQLPSIWVVFVGGTGTGKSTLFNAFCGKHLSKTGVERPKTCGPVLYVHEDCPIEKGYPFHSVQMKHHSSEDSDSLPASGTPGHLLLLEHRKKEWSDLVVADTPDLDSVEVENREISEDLSLLSDAIVFVTSQEKYADEVPYQFLLKTVKEKTPYFFFVNKVQDNLTREEVLSTLETQGIQFRKDRIWLIPRAPSHPCDLIAEHPDFHDFVNCFSREFPSNALVSLREADHSRRTEELRICVGRLMTLLERENKEAHKWLERLKVLSQGVSQDLIREQKERFTAQSRELLSRQIRRLFDKYDVLARPRRFVTGLFLTPFRFLGFKKKDSLQAHRQALLKIRQQIDTAPTLRAIEKLNRLVLEKLSPSNADSALFRKLRDPDMVLNDEDINRHIREEQDRLTTWLEERFQELANGIPQGKKWGIYSTSLLWGILIISFEIAIGGGFTVLDAVLNSVLAPLVTKGAMEMFAYHEIQKVARELGERYQQGLISAVHFQRDRYERGLKSLLTPIESLQALHQSLI
jgi:hypothetical protein